MSWVPLATLQSFIGNSNVNDAAAMQTALDMACDRVDWLCGPTMTTTVTEVVKRHNPDPYTIIPSYALTLQNRATAITSIKSWPDGGTLDLSSYYVNGQLLKRIDGYIIDVDLTVTYTTGAATAPAWAVAAACLIAAQWFKSRLQPNRNDPTVQVGFLVPNQADELMEPYTLAPVTFA